MGLIIKNNVIYNGAESEPVVYSLDEREVGVWTDGKPLYEKTLYVASGQINSTTSLNMPSQNDIERLVSYKGSVYDIDDQRYYALPYERIADIEGIWVSCHVLPDHTLTPVLFTRQSTTYNLSNIFVTIQYTKTTDQPGSGTWTPSGVKTVHYSENEQVVGTWIDGSTIYERTLYKDLSGQAEHWYVYLDTLIDDINDYTIINFQGQFQFKEESYIYAHVIPNPQGSYYINRDNSRWYLYFHTGNATCDWGYMTATIRYVKEILGRPSS